MEKARATFFCDVSERVASRVWLAMLFGGVTTATAVFAMISQAGTAVPLNSQGAQSSQLPHLRRLSRYAERFQKGGRRLARVPGRVPPPIGMSSKRSIARYEKIMLRNLTPRDTDGLEDPDGSPAGLRRHRQVERGTSRALGQTCRRSGGRGRADADFRRRRVCLLTVCWQQAWATTVAPSDQLQRSGPWPSKEAAIAATHNSR